MAYQTLSWMGVPDPISGKNVLNLSVKTAVSWAISSMGRTTPVADPDNPYPNYVSSIVQELYGLCVAVSDPVRAASLSQQKLVAKQIQQTKEKTKEGITTKRRRDEVDFCPSIAKRLRTEGKFFRTSVSKAIQTDEFGTPEHVDVAYSQSGNKFGFKTLESDLGQGFNSYLETVKLMFSSNYDSRFMCCAQAALRPTLSSTRMC